MTNETAPQTLYMLWRQVDEGNMQFAFAVGAELAKRRMIDEGFRVFEVRHERFAEDLGD